MKEKVLEKIKSIGVYGVMHFNETKRFEDDQYATRENLYQYRISKIKVFLGEKRLILGVQAFYKNIKGEEIAGAEGRDKSIKELDIKTLEIPPNDYLCNLNIFVGEDYITKLKFSTKKGKELVAGTDDGEDKVVSQINSNKDNIILCISGGYRKSLELISCKYLAVNQYLGPTLGYFELKKILRHEDFRKKTQEKLAQFNETDKVLFRACCLPDNAFNEVIKYCLY